MSRFSPVSALLQNNQGEESGKSSVFLALNIRWELRFAWSTEEALFRPEGGPVCETQSCQQACSF